MTMNDQAATRSFQRLERASQLLGTAVVLANETTDADLTLCRAINQAVVVLAETSRMLVDESMRDLSRRA